MFVVVQRLVVECAKDQLAFSLELDFFEFLQLGHHVEKGELR
jgi:hypothetical protein